jgi:hypothetical protein
MSRFWMRLAARLSFAGTVVLIEGGRARALRGPVRAALLGELSDLAAACDVGDACIRAYLSPDGFRLRFTGIPARFEQRFRNVWGVACL